MGILDRLGGVIRSYFVDDDLGEAAGGRPAARARPAAGDPDLEAAYQELDDWLDAGRTPGGGRTTGGGRTGDWTAGGGRTPGGGRTTGGGRTGDWTAGGGSHQKTGGGRTGDWTAGGGRTTGGGRTDDWTDAGRTGDWTDAGRTDDWTAGRQSDGGGPKTTTPPVELRPDFAELGVAFGAPAGVCKDAYKTLLKIHHPDRHAGHPGRVKTATEKTARINAAYDRIERWRATGRTD